MTSLQAEHFDKFLDALKNLQSLAKLYHGKISISLNNEMMEAIEQCAISRDNISNEGHPNCLHANTYQRLINEGMIVGINLERM